MGAFGLDALSSVAYGPDEILYVLVLAGSAGVALDMPVAFAIAALLAIVAFSYRQTNLNRAAAAALDYARSISDDVVAVHVAAEEDGGEDFRRRWAEWADGAVRLELIASPYREVVSPLVDLVEKLARGGDGRVTVVVSAVVPDHFWQAALHNQLEYVLTLALLDEPGVVIASVPVRLAG
jgi:hypothetical protein